MSGSLGTLAFDGTISNPRNIGVDMDALGVDETGQIFAADIVLNATMNDLYEIEPTSFLGASSTLSDTRLLNDLAFANGSLFAISNASPLLVTLDSTNGSVISEIGLDLSGSYFGLAVVPEPSTLVLSGLGLGLIGMIARLRRRD